MSSSNPRGKSSYAIVGGFDTGVILKKYLPDADTSPLMSNSSNGAAHQEPVVQDGERDGWNSPFREKRIEAYLQQRGSIVDCSSSSSSSSSLEDNTITITRNLFSQDRQQNQEDEELSYESLVDDNEDATIIDQNDDDDDTEGVEIHPPTDTSTSFFPLFATTTSHQEPFATTTAKESSGSMKSLGQDNNSNNAILLNADFNKKMNAKMAAAALSSPPLVARRKQQPQQQHNIMFFSSKEENEEERDPEDLPNTTTVSTKNNTSDDTPIRQGAHRAKKLWQTRAVHKTVVDSSSPEAEFMLANDSVNHGTAIGDIPSQQQQLATTAIFKEKVVAAKVAVAGELAARKFEHMFGKHLSSQQQLEQQVDTTYAESSTSEKQQREISFVEEEKVKVNKWIKTILSHEDDDAILLSPQYMTSTNIQIIVQHVTQTLKIQMIVDDEPDISAWTTPPPCKNNKNRTSNNSSTTKTPPATSSTSASNRADWGSEEEDEDVIPTTTTILHQPITLQNVQIVIRCFLQWILRISLFTGIPCPSIVEILLLDCSSSKGYIRNRLATEEQYSIHSSNNNDYYHLFHQVIFSTEEDHVIPLLTFFANACEKISRTNPVEPTATPIVQNFKPAGAYQIGEEIKRLVVTETCYEAYTIAPLVRTSSDMKAQKQPKPLYIVPPTISPSPAEIALIHLSPHLLLNIHSFLGDPLSICRSKQVCKPFNTFIERHQHAFFQQAVRIGGMDERTRPKLWLWITLTKCREEQRNSTLIYKSSSWHKRCYSFNESHVHPDCYGWEDIASSSNYQTEVAEDVQSENSFIHIQKPPSNCGGVVTSDDSEQQHHVISKQHRRDDFLLLEQIGREGKWRSVIARDVVRAFGTLPPHKTKSFRKKDSIVRILAKGMKSARQRRHTKAPAAISEDTPALGCYSETSDDDSVGSKVSIPESELVLSGIQAQDTKEDLQNKLAAVLHALAAAYDDVGYCQGVDYVVGHLMRILQKQILALAKSGRLPSPLLAKYNTYTDETNGAVVVEEALFHVMDCLFSYYNLKHMYWPELRFLKRTCKVFERIVEQKLPVLADHFEHHELNVSLFALGWFQTLFLYLPSMPMATVCHVWDIWLVERSFKIFFRVGAAILLLSQPTLLNQELEGMMTYLNTFPDSTLLCPDILIECALSIKITNRMLIDIENELLEEGMMF